VSDPVESAITSEHSRQERAWEERMAKAIVTDADAQLLRRVASQIRTYSNMRDATELERVADTITAMHAASPDSGECRKCGGTGLVQENTGPPIACSLCSCEASEIMREALASLKALNQGVYDNENLSPGQRNFAKLCIDKIDEALSSICKGEQ
jgi:hypothetical protein